MDEQIFVVGLPVVIGIDSTGAVTFEVDLTEAGVSLDEDTDFSIDLTDQDRERYRLLVEAAASRLGQHFKITSPEPTNPL